MRMTPASFSFLAHLGEEGPGPVTPTPAVPVQTARLLPEGALYRVEAVPGTRVSCLTGVLWIDHPAEAYLGRAMQRAHGRATTPNRAGSC